jgi:hypothetical protein
VQWLSTKDMFFTELAEVIDDYRFGWVFGDVRTHLRERFFAILGCLTADPMPPMIFWILRWKGKSGSNCMTSTLGWDTEAGIRSFQDSIVSFSTSCMMFSQRMLTYFSPVFKLVSPGSPFGLSTTETQTAVISGSGSPLQNLVALGRMPVRR